MGPDAAIVRFLHDEEGSTAVEYGLICTFIAIVIISMAGAGGALEAIYDMCRRVIAAVRGANTGDSGST